MGRQGLRHPALAAQLPSTHLCLSDGQGSSRRPPTSFSLPLFYFKHPHPNFTAIQASLGSPLSGLGEPEQAPVPLCLSFLLGKLETVVLAQHPPSIGEHELSTHLYGRHPITPVCKLSHWGRNGTLGAQGPSSPSPPLLLFIESCVLRPHFSRTSSSRGRGELSKPHSPTFYLLRPLQPRNA